MKFSIELSLSKVKVINVEAESVAQAIEKAKDKNIGWKIDAIDDKFVIGYDEGTDEPIFEGDEYVTCEEGTMELLKNVDADRLM